MLTGLSRLPAVLITIGIIFSGCSLSSLSASAVRHGAGDLSALLNDHHGRVLILLLGMEGCPGTAKATIGLDEYLSSKPGKVSVVRLDVPLPGKQPATASAWDHSFPRFVDTGRRVANKLEFFYYPTLYVFDGQGYKRYVGAFDKGKVSTMVRGILAEKPGSERRIYTPPMPAVGQQVAAFAGSTLGGDSVSQRSLMGERGLVMIFARTSCQFSAADMPQFKEIADRFRGKGVNTVIVNQQEDLDVIKPMYARKCAGVQVVWDHDGRISQSFGVDAVPFFFLVNKDGKIASRRSFTHAAAIDAINAMLGLKTGGQRFKPTEGG